MRRVYTCQHLLSFTAKVGMIHFAVPMLNPSKDWSIGLDWTSVVAQCWIYCIRNKILNGCYTYYKLWYSILHLIFTAVNFHKKSIDCTCMNKDYFKVLKILNLSWPSLFSWYQNLKNKLKNYIPSPSGNFNLQRIVIFAHFQAEETLHIDSLTNTDVLKFFSAFLWKIITIWKPEFLPPIYWVTEHWTGPRRLCCFVDYPEAGTECHLLSSHRFWWQVWQYFHSADLS